MCTTWITDHETTYSDEDYVIRDETSLNSAIDDRSKGSRWQRSLRKQRNCQIALQGATLRRRGVRLALTSLELQEHDLLRSHSALHIMLTVSYLTHVRCQIAHTRSASAASANLRIPQHRVALRVRPVLCLIAVDQHQLAGEFRSLAQTMPS